MVTTLWRSPPGGATRPLAASWATIPRSRAAAGVEAGLGEELTVRRGGGRSGTVHEAALLDVASQHGFVRCQRRLLRGGEGGHLHQEAGPGREVGRVGPADHPEGHTVGAAVGVGPAALGPGNTSVGTPGSTRGSWPAASTPSTSAEPVER